MDEGCITSSSLDLNLGTLISVPQIYYICPIDVYNISAFYMRDSSWSWCGHLLSKVVTKETISLYGNINTLLDYDVSGYA